MDDILKFKDAHKGETCLVIGNGPSLALRSNEFLARWPSFGSNRVWRKFEPTYYVCTDPLDVEKNMDYILSRSGPKFIQSTFGIDYSLEIIYRSKDPGWATFTPNPTKPMYDGCTVTFVCLELAYWMGFTTVYLVGVNHDYTWEGPRLQTITVGEDYKDPNHFIPDYHQPGELWQPPNLKRMEHGYRLARDAYKKDKRKIINLTIDTKLDVFERKQELQYG